MSRADWARWGFWDPARADAVAASVEARLPGVAIRLGRLCAAAGDPDEAWRSCGDLLAAWETPPDFGDPGWGRLVALLGGSAGLGRWLVRRPGDAAVCFGGLAPWTPQAILADVVDRTNDLDPERAAAELRWAYRRHLTRIATRDLTEPAPGDRLEETCQELTDLNDAVMEAAVRIAGREVPGAESVRFAVIALGKTGAREVNYLSDVDVLFVADDAGPVATRWATRVTKVCSAYGAAGTIWDLDANLRPEGAAGPLVRSLAGLTTYYTTWASNWEFQAMLKARPMAGDAALGQAFVDMVGPEVWRAAGRDGFVAEAQAMRARVVATLPADEAARDIKLSAGGLRDTEFAVQLLQLVHGRADERLRVPATLPGLRALVDHGYIGRADGAALDQAYRLQRVLEHRLQLYGLRRTHLMPTDDMALRRLARSAGLAGPDEVDAAWRTSARTVRNLHRRIFYSPLLDAVSRLPGEAIRLTPEAAATRLRALGYADPAGALRHIEALTSGLTRKAEILRQLLPVMLGWIADGPNPDAGLLAFRQVTEALGDTPTYLRALRDEGRMAQNLARVLSTSRYVAGLLQRSPTSVDMLADPEYRLPTPGQLADEFAGVRTRYGAGPRTPEVIRAVRRRELLRLAMADILGVVDTVALGRDLAALTTATIDAGLAWARDQVEDAPAMALIALGSWGGESMSYASDADLMVVLADGDDPYNVRKGTEVVRLLRQGLHATAPDPDLPISTDLRPEGKDGPMVRTLASYRAYYQKWALPWEAQALLHARWGGGDRDLARAFLDTIDPVRYPADGLTPSQVIDIRRTKARVEAERVGRGDPRDNVKLGPGGLSDVDWLVQLLQLRYAGTVPALRVTGTLTGLAAAEAAGLIGADDAGDLRAAYTLATRIRGAHTILTNRAGDGLPPDATELGQLAQVLGYARSQGSALADEWHRVARRARAVADRLFWTD